MTRGKSEKIKGNSKASFNLLYKRYSLDAKRRGLSFELTEEQFRSLTKRDCWYCGIKPIQAGYASSKSSCGDYYLYNGIDRIDNNKGYTLANSVPCCGMCNTMKRKLSVEDFINQIKAIVLNLNLEI